jgi:hypothetical protein
MTVADRVTRDAAAARALRACAIVAGPLQRSGLAGDLFPVLRLRLARRSGRAAVFV